MAVNRAIISVLIACCVMFANNGKVEGCSCQPIHPQAMFCHSDFVVKAFVRTSRVVELRPNGKYRQVDIQKPDLIALPEISDENATVGYTPSVDSNTSTEESTEPSSVETPEYSVESDESPDVDINQNTGPAVTGDANDTSIIRRKRMARHRRYYAGYAPDTLGMSPEPVTPTSTTMVQYRISITRVFKGLQNFTEKQMKFVYTPPAPLCNVKLSTERTPHILMGTLHKGVMMIRMCDFKLDFSKLTKSEKKNVIHNMERRFPESCESCAVKVCNGYNCNEPPNEEVLCEWRNARTAPTPEACQYSCVRTKSGKCKWYNPLDKEDSSSAP